MPARDNTMFVITVFVMLQNYGPYLDQTIALGQVTTIPVTLEEMLNKLCPGVDICNQNATNTDLKPNGLLGPDVVSCCTGCSCHPQCKERSNCCFPDEDENTNNKESASRYKCLQTAIASPSEELPKYVPAYHTVIKSPTDGCLSTKPVEIKSGLIIYPSCENSTANLPYFPVYSDTPREIYHNIQCALCHGVKDPHYFIPSFLCGNLGRYNSNPFSEIILFTETGRVPPRCHVIFKFYKPSLISNKRCYDNVIKTCKTDKVGDYPVLDVLDLPINLTQHLCESGLYSPYPTDLRVYKNVFCFLCGQKHGVRDMECRYDYNIRSEDTAFISLFDPGVYTSLQNGFRQETYPIACLDDKGVLDQDSEDGNCYRIYCPTGRTMDKNGDCAFITNYLTSPINVHLKLLPVFGEDSRLNLENVDKKEFLSDLIKGNPWPDDWTIQKVYSRADNFECKERAHLLVDLMATRNNPSEFVSEIENMLSVHWISDLNGTVVTSCQSLREYGLRASSTIPKMWHVDDQHFGCNSVIWESILVKPILYKEPPISIKKLFFYNQIRLKTNDFAIQSEQEILQSNVTRRDLSIFEFELIRHEDGYQAMVCLEDTILKAHDHNKGARKDGMVVVLIFLLIYEYML